MQRAETIAIVVLGAAVWPGGVPSPTLQRRAQHAARLYLTGHGGHVIGCGGIGRHPPSEAAVIAGICRTEGVPDTALHLDEQSRSTEENIANAMVVMRGLGCTRALLVTDRYHAFRARLIARGLGLEATSASPAPIGTMRARLLWSWLREIPATLLALVRLARLRAGRGR